MYYYLSFLLIAILVGVKWYLIMYGFDLIAILSIMVTQSGLGFKRICLAKSRLWGEGRRERAGHREPVRRLLQ